MIPTVNRVIVELDQRGGQENRLSWWLDIAAHIQAGNLITVFEKLSAHNADDDYPQQCEAICNSIAAYLRQE